MVFNTESNAIDLTAEYDDCSSLGSMLQEPVGVDLTEDMVDLCESDDETDHRPRKSNWGEEKRKRMHHQSTDSDIEVVEPTNESKDIKGKKRSRKRETTEDKIPQELYPHDKAETSTKHLKRRRKCYVLPSPACENYEQTKEEDVNSKQANMSVIRLLHTTHQKKCDVPPDDQTKEGIKEDMGVHSQPLSHGERHSGTQLASSDNSRTESVIYLDNSVLRVVGGKKGQCIRDLMEKSGTNIWVDLDIVNNERAIYISGTLQSVRVAVQMISDLVARAFANAYQYVPAGEKGHNRSRPTQAHMHHSPPRHQHHHDDYRSSNQGLKQQPSISTVEMHNSSTTKGRGRKRPRATNETLKTFSSPLIDKDPLGRLIFCEAIIKVPFLPKKFNCEGLASFFHGKKGFLSTTITKLGHRKHRTGMVTFDSIENAVAAMKSVRQRKCPWAEQIRSEEYRPQRVEHLCINDIIKDVDDCNMIDGAVEESTHLRTVSDTSTTEGASRAPDAKLLIPETKDSINETGASILDHNDFKNQTNNSENTLLISRYLEDAGVHRMPQLNSEIDNRGINEKSVDNLFGSIELVNSKRCKKNERHEENSKDNFISDNTFSRTVIESESSQGWSQPFYGKMQISEVIGPDVQDGSMKKVLKCYGKTSLTRCNSEEHTSGSFLSYSKTVSDTISTRGHPQTTLCREMERDCSHREARVVPSSNTSDQAEEGTKKNVGKFGVRNTVKNSSKSSYHTTKISIGPAAISCKNNQEQIHKHTEKQTKNIDEDNCFNTKESDIFAVPKTSSGAERIQKSSFPEVLVLETTEAGVEIRYCCTDKGNSASTPGKAHCKSGDKNLEIIAHSPPTIPPPRNIPRPSTKPKVSNKHRDDSDAEQKYTGSWNGDAGETQRAYVTEAGIKKKNQKSRGSKSHNRFVVSTKFREDVQFNYSFSQENALLEQERLFRQARESIQAQNARTFASGSDPPAFVVPVDDLSKLDPNHWLWSDPYTRLGLPPSSSVEVIKKQYRRLALQCHPDKNKSEHSANRFQAIIEAYQKLTRSE